MTYFYFRSQAEMAHTCRGTINLAGASLESEDSCNFVISNGGAQVTKVTFKTILTRGGKALTMTMTP